MKKVTIIDIANEMHLSRNTVAKALNGGKVTNETRMEVIRTAKRMGYTKIEAELLDELDNYKKNNIKGTILVLFYKWESVRVNRMLAGISDMASENGLRVQILMVDENNITVSTITSQINSDVKGVILLGVFPNSVVREISKTGVIMTFFNTPVNAQEYIEIGDVYSLESFYSMNKLISYCIEMKRCEQFAFIGNAEGSRGIQARMLGFINACNQHGITIKDEQLFTRPKKEVFFNYNEVAAVMENMPELPDAIVCEDDDVAKNVATWLYRNTENAGKNIIITGFGDTIEKDFMRQDILTVEVRMEEIGKRLVMSIINRMEYPEIDISFVTIATYPRILKLN